MPILTRNSNGTGVHPRHRYQAYTLHNFRPMLHSNRLTMAQKFAVEVVARVLPFRTNNYVTEELIDWNIVPDDPLFLLNFPQQEMLRPHHFAKMATLIRKGVSDKVIEAAANEIRLELNPHPAGQLQYNRPTLEGALLPGMQHKYQETVLFFPSQGQTCHAYCTFCFRWPQFVGMKGLKFSMREYESLAEYVVQHPEVTDILFTGGDPLIMRTHSLATYIEPLLSANLSHLTTIRLGTKSLSFWPYRFLTDPDADDLLRLFEKVVRNGKHLALMAHFSHPRELETHAVRQAIIRIRNTGAEIRTQAPLLAHINAKPTLWAEMWRKQVQLGCIPYYMFIVRDTGAQHYFSVPLARAWHIFREAYQQMSGLARTVRGPSMSTGPGKVEVIGVDEVRGEKVFVLRLLQGRNPDWTLRPFFAQYDPDAIWLDELRPAFGADRFFFEHDKPLNPIP